jgi:hypothetical protein
MAHHALLGAILAAVASARHVVVEGARDHGLIWAAGAVASTCCVGRGGATCFPILANGPFPWVLVICKTLLHHGLQCGGREGVAAEGRNLGLPHGSEREGITAYIQLGAPSQLQRPPF